MRREETEDEQEMKKEGRQKGFPVAQMLSRAVPVRVMEACLEEQG